MKDIWIINHYAIPPEWGGLSRHYYFSKYLAQNGYNVKIFSASKIHNSGINVFDPYVLSKASANLIIFKPTILMKYGSSFNKTFDYLASGKPIISNLQQNYDLLQHYGCGVSAKGGSPQDLVDAIELVYNLPEEKYKQMCENTRSAVESFDYKKLTEKLIEVIGNLSFKQNLA